MDNVVIQVENLGKKYRIHKTPKKRLVGDFINASIIKTKNKIKMIGQSSSKDNKEDLYMWALKDISFEIEEGESIGIIGSNGAGKSTLLKILSQITSPTTGRVILRGRVGSLLEVGTGFHAELTGRENVYLNGAILGMKRMEINQKFNEIVAFSEIGQYLDTPVKHYSSGMRMRLAFSVAAHLDPEILLIDEVLAVGDIAFQKKSINKMNDVVNEGRTVLFVSHNMGAIRALCQKAIFINNGKIEYFGDVGATITSYLKMNDGVTASEVSFKPDSNKPIEILSVKMFDHNEQQSSSFAHDQNFKFQLSISINQVDTGVFVALKIFDSNLHPILVSHEFEQNENCLGTRSPGEITYDIQIPSPLLPPGKYRIGIEIIRKKKKRQKIIFQKNHILPFEIFDNGSMYSRTSIQREGILHIPFEWKLLE